MAGLAAAALPAARAADVTAQLVDHGNRLEQSGMSGRALNVWDLQAFDGQVFLGGGSSVDNVGPMPIWAFDHAGGSFGDDPELTVNQEGAELFKVIDGSLYLPSADPRNPTTEDSKFYRRDADGVWTHYLSPGGRRLAHVRDLALFDGHIVTVGNSRAPYANVGGFTGQPSAIAVDYTEVQAATGGEHTLSSFAGAVDLDETQPSNHNWFFSTFSYGGTLYATTANLSPIDRTWAPGGDEQPLPMFAQWDADRDTFVVSDAHNDDFLLPAATGDTRITHRLWNPIEYNGALVYPVRTYSLYDVDGLYHGVYNQTADFLVKPSPTDAPLRPVFGDADARGEDVLVFDGVLYALANAKQSDGSYLVYIYASTDPANADPAAWQEILHFESPNLARSFDRIGDTFYFGLGYATGEAVGQAGSLWSVTVPEPTAAAAAMLLTGALVLRRSPRSAIRP